MPSSLFAFRFAIFVVELTLKGEAPVPPVNLAGFPPVFTTLSVGPSRDVDPHQLVQPAGRKLQLGKPMMMGGTMQVAFPTKGTYRFTTHTLEMPGMGDVKTIGPDNKLHLTVKVV